MFRFLIGAIINREKKGADFHARRERNRSRKDQKIVPSRGTAQDATVGRRQNNVPQDRYIHLYSYFTLDELFMAYVFFKKRYKKPVALYESHQVTNYRYFLVLMTPSLDDWGFDPEADDIARDLDKQAGIRTGDSDTGSLADLNLQADPLDEPTDEQQKQAYQELSQLISSET